MNLLINQIELIAQKWLAIMCTSSIQLGIFLGLILIISTLVKKQSASFLYMLWLIGLFKAFIPITIKFPDFFPATNFAISENLNIFILQEISINEINPHILTYRGYLLLLWMFGIILLIIFWLYNNIQFKKFTRSCSPFNKKLLNANNSLNVKIYVGPAIKTPFTRGILSSKIYLPQQALLWPERELNAVILHEFAHIKRKDTFFIALQNIIQIMYFFHPMVWIASLQLSRHRENACDDMAIHSMQGDFLEYSKYLLNSINRIVYWQPLPSIVNYYFQSKKLIFKRFEYILNNKEDVMVKLNSFQKLIIISILCIGIVISCQKKNGEQPTIPASKVDVLVSKKDLSEIKFVPYDSPPSPIGGFNAINQNLIYPESARKAGIEGRIVLMTKIGTAGIIEEIVIKESFDNQACEAAAIEAVKSVKWNPAIKDEKPVTVWVSIPVSFKLKDDEYSKKKIQKLSSSIDKSLFVEYDTPPEPVNGFVDIQKHLVYPETATKAGIEGRVVVQAYINEKGEINVTKILESMGSDYGCDEAAIQAIKAVKWIPAKKDNKPVAVWIAIPVVFSSK